VGRPQPEAHELGRHADGERLDRLHEALRGKLASLSQLHHHAEQALAAERNAQDRSDADLIEAVGKQVVERAPQRTGGG
jgi:hypothetical protein